MLDQDQPWDDDFDYNFLAEAEDIPLHRKKDIYQLLNDEVGSFLQQLIGDDLGDGNSETPPETAERLSYIFDTLVQPYMQHCANADGYAKFNDLFKLSAFILYGSINLFLAHDPNETCDNPLCPDCYPVQKNN